MLKNRALWICLLCWAAFSPTAEAQNQRTVSELIEAIKAQKERELALILESLKTAPSPPRVQSAPRWQGSMPAPIAQPARSAPVIEPRSAVVLPSGPPATQQSLKPVGPAAIGQARSAPVIEPQATVALPSGPPTTQQSLAPVGPAAIEPARSAPVIEPQAMAALPSGSPTTQQTATQQSLAPVEPAAIRPQPWPQVFSLSGVNGHHSSELIIDRRVYLVDEQELPRDLEGWLILSISERGVCVSRQGDSRCLSPPGSARMAISSAQNLSPPSMAGSQRLDPGVRP
jgi:hypothetical protein